MTGVKSMTLERFCRERGQAYSCASTIGGHGASGGEFRDGTIGAWLRIRWRSFDKLTAGPQILVGSSMGGWLMLLLALGRSERIAGLVGIAAAPDFTEDIWNGFLDSTAGMS